MDTRDDHQHNHLIVIVVNVCPLPHRSERRLRLLFSTLWCRALQLGHLPQRLKHAASRLWNYKGLPRLAAWSSVFAMIISILALLK